MSFIRGFHYIVQYAQNLSNEASWNDSPIVSVSVLSVSGGGVWRVEVVMEVMVTMGAW